MKKLKLTLIPVCIGMVLLFVSWYTSYPVSIDSPYDFIYNHISPLYWASLAILFASFFFIAMNTKNNILRWTVTFGTVLLMYSVPYFYYMIPGSDSHNFRGLTEYFISTEDLSPTKPHSYYQWPLFFILNKVATSSITGLDLRCFEFMLFIIIGFLFATSFYLYLSKARANGYVAVVTSFVIIRYFFNYQWAPFSVAACLLLLLFVLDEYASRKRGATLAMLIIFSSITLTHAFVPVFFIVYSLMTYIVNKNRKYLKLFLLTLIIYLTVSIYYKATFFTDIVQQLKSVYTLEYTGIVEATLAGSVAPRPYIDVVAQTFSRTVVITTTIMTGLGFITILIKKKLRKVDYAILLTGISYVATGSILGILGTRAFFLVIIPASLGISYLAEGKLKKYFRPLFLILIILSIFIPIHGTFYDRQIFFQTKKAYNCANFMIYNYNWQTPSILLSHFRFMQYLSKRSGSEDVVFKYDFYSKNFLEDMKNYDCVVYTVGLGKSFLRLNCTVEKSLSIFEINQFNLIYNSGNFSHLFLRNSSNTTVP